MKYKAETAELLNAIRRRATPNLPLAGLYFTIGVYFAFGTYSIGTQKIGMHQFVPISGLVTLGLAFGFIYAAGRKAFVRTSDKAIKLLIEAVLNTEAESLVSRRLDDVQAAHQRRQVQQAEDGRTPKPPQPPR